MKFTIVVVMLALAIGAQGSAISWAHHGYPGDYHHGWAAGPYGHGGWDGPWGHAGPTHGISLAQGGHHVGGPWGHASVAHHGGPVAHGHGHDGHYVAKTLGAVHTAPLAGHHASVSSVNVAPAPGTHH